MRESEENQDLSCQFTLEIASIEEEDDWKEIVVSIDQPTEIINVDEKTITHKSIDPRKKDFVNEMEKRLNLVLSLDQILWKFDQNLTNNRDLKIIACKYWTCNNDPQNPTVVVLRPCAESFLTRMSKLFKITLLVDKKWECSKEICKFLKKNQTLEDISISNSLSSIAFSAEDLERTIILCDSHSETFLNTIILGKFIQFRTFLSKEEYQYYSHFTNWYSDGLELGGSEEEKACSLLAYQLELNRSRPVYHLKRFLEGIALDYCKGKGVLEVSELIEKRLKKILNGLKLCIISNNEKRVQMFTRLVKKFGGKTVDAEKAYYILSDQDIEKEQEKMIGNLLRENDLVSLVSVSWLVECLFCGSRVSIKDFMWNLKK